MKTFESYVNERKSASSNIIDQVAKLTDKNQHNKARKLVAKEIKFKELESSYDALDNLQKFFKELTPELKKIRQDLDARLKKAAKSKLDNATEILKKL